MIIHEAIQATFPEQPDRQTVLLKGRDAWALQLLALRGERGCTPIDTPGPRWSAYVFNLRRMGFDIETVTEKHGKPYPGTHARYVLHDAVTITGFQKKAA